MRTIWKFHLPLADLVSIDMPDCSHVLRVGMQDGAVYLWALVYDDMPLIRYEFRVVGTGHPAPELDKYIGTVDDGPFVWHVFEVVPKGLLSPADVIPRTA